MTLMFIDTRQITISVGAATIGLNYLPAHDTDEVIKNYTTCRLLADIITYGTLYGGLPGNPHYSHIEDNLSRIYGCDIDSEYLHFVLDELERITYYLYGIDTTLLEVVNVDHFLLVARQLPDAVY
jgi:hypothetical protein